MYQKEAARKAQIELDALKEYEARKAAAAAEREAAEGQKEEEKEPEVPEQEGKKL
jgi:hypothetical protein